MIIPCTHAHFRSRASINMCGIAGVIYRDPSRPVDRAVLRAMGDAIAHRGPDAEGYWIGPGVGLAHRRLSIIDLAGGEQPIGNEDGSIQVVFNGEIYNYRELRAACSKPRATASGRAATPKSIVHLYEEHGDAAGRAAARHVRLRPLGPAASAGCCWPATGSASSRSTSTATTRSCSSAPSSRRSWPTPASAATVDLAALEDYLAFGMVPGPRSIFRRIEKLPPATRCWPSAPTTWARAPRALLAAAARAGPAAARPRSGRRRSARRSTRPCGCT